MTPADMSQNSLQADCGAVSGSGWEDAAAHGIDLSLIEDSLRLTPWQRLVENDRALSLVRMLEQARILDDGTPHTSP